jgi:cell division septation protein DedD
MVKRGIGAAVLAIVAALLLGYLLKGKSQERQEVVDMNLPGATDVKQSLNIPSLKGADGENTAQNSADASQDSSSAVQTAAGVAAGAAAVAAGTVVASATGAADKANQAIKDIQTKEVAVNTFKNKGDDLDFTIRPPKGEKRVIVDNIGKSKQQIASASSTNASNNSDKGDIAANADANRSAGKAQNSGAITRSSPSQGTVVASSEKKVQKKTYRPRLVDEKKRSASYGIVVAENSSNPSRAEKERRERKKAAELRAADRKKAQNKAQKQAKPQKKAGKGHFSVQLLATSSSSRANNLKNVMSKEGYRVSVSKTAKRGKVLFRVRIGHYSTRAAAVSAQRKMKRRYKRNQAVNSSIIVSR